jgi:hypothetical protein
VIPCYNEEEFAGDLPPTRRHNERFIRRRDLARKPNMPCQRRLERRDWDIIGRCTRASPFRRPEPLENRGIRTPFGRPAVAKDHADAAVSLDADLQDDVEALAAS